LTVSTPTPNTIGIVAVAALAAFASGSFCTADGRDVHYFCVVAQGLQKKGVSRFVLCVISMS
jgi:hypothetical protein